LSALTDQLNQHLDKMDSEGGLSTLHLLSLPSSINRILRLFLRSKQIAYEDLRTAVDGMPADNRLSYPELDEMLDLLCTREWLVKTEDGTKIFYGINLRPAVASASAKASTTADDTVVSEGAAKASEAWEKAGMDSLGAPERTSSDIHKELTGSDQSTTVEPVKEEVDSKTQESSESNEAETVKHEKVEKQDDEDPHRDKKKLSADDLWDVLD
jgi:hypothetical protein